MNTTTYEIVEKTRLEPFGFTGIGDFKLRESGSVAAEEILHNRQITLYALDFESKRAVFVDTPSDIDLSQSPFMYMTQYDHATHVLMTSFETMIQLGQSVSLDDRRLVFLHSTGRAGSTLASQIFAQVEGVVNLPEPDALTTIVKARHYWPDDKERLLPILDAALRLQCKQRAEQSWVVKGRGFVIEVGDWLQELYPRSKNIILYRNAETYLESALRAFGFNEERTPEEQRAWEKESRSWFVPVVPLIAQVPADEYLSGAGMITLAWLSIMERAVALQEMGAYMLPIRYADWHAAPRETAVAMLNYCGCCPDDLSGVYEPLQRDSQAGTEMSQESVKRYDRALQAHELEEIERHLQNHPFIKTADYEIANTLHVQVTGAN